MIKDNSCKHIAIIMDGNGRWAKKRFLPRVMGHKEGAKNIAKVAKHASSLGISHLTVFCFSTENWNRPKDEVNFLMNLPMDFYKLYKDKSFAIRKIFAKLKILP